MTGRARRQQRKRARSAWRPWVESLRDLQRLYWFGSEHAFLCERPKRSNRS